MKRISILCILLILGFTAFSQSYRKTNFSAPLKTVVHMGDPDAKFFNPSLTNLDQHPVPYFTDFGNKKKYVQEQRALARAQRGSNNASFKTLGLAPNPIVDTGWLANVSSGIPMDNDIAISNNGIIISAVNSNIYVYDTLGNRLLIRNVLDLDTALNPFPRISDPRLLYDPNQDKFILVCFTGNTSTTSNVLVGFSSTNDPLGNWNFYALNGNPFNDSTWSDYPIISISDKDLFMTFNQIQEGVSWQTGFRQSVIYQIKKSDGFVGSPLQYTLWDSLKFGNTLYRNICPAKYQENNMGDDMYFLSVRNVDISNDSIYILHIDDSYQSGQATITHRVVQSPVNYGFPPNPSMNNGNYLMTNDGRVLAAIYENDYIHFGANSVHPTLLNAGVLLGTIKNVSSANPIVEAEVFSDTLTEYGYPSMTYMGSAPGEHRVLFSFDHCYTDSFPGISIIYKDAAGDYSDMVRIINGTGSINYFTDTNERWGDYSGIQKKYNNVNQAYLAGCYARGSGYRAWVAKINNGDSPVSVSDRKKEYNSDLYPNPVISEFTTRFTLSKKERLQFNLYDMNGRLIKKLLHAECKAGENQFSFNKGVLSKGNYIFTIQGEQHKIFSEIISME